MKQINIYKQALNKKIDRYNKLVQEHINDVKSVNGQPLNDKRNGYKTIDRWNNQERRLIEFEKDIEKSKERITKLEYREENKQYVTSRLPQCIIDELERGSLTQWNKHPHIFFVPGVNKARIVYNIDTQQVEHRYTNYIRDKHQWKMFAKIFNRLAQQIN